MKLRRDGSVGSVLNRPFFPGSKLTSCLNAEVCCLPLTSFGETSYVLVRVLPHRATEPH